MRTYPLHEARAEFSKLVKRALSGEPQRVTHYGKEAVVIVSEGQGRPKERAKKLLGVAAGARERARRGAGSRPSRRSPGPTSPSSPRSIATGS